MSKDLTPSDPSPSPPRSRRIGFRDRLLLGIVLYFALALLLRAAIAQPLDEISAGTLLMESEPGEWVAAPVLDADVDIRVTGLMAEVTVSQQFRNDSGQWIEALYAFPLPDDAAVNRLVLRVGERRIEGEIKEKQAAIRTYRAARDAGQTASLVTQQRPNLFTTRAANIGPGETVAVEIGYVQQLTYRDHRFSLRFPMTVTPRFEPDATAMADRRGGGRGHETPADETLPTPYLVDDPDLGPMTGIRVHLRPGFDLVRLESRYHDIEIAESNGLYVLELADGRVPADRDFELVWEPALKAAPTAAVLTEQTMDGRFAMIMVMPPADEQTVSPPRELILVVDTSGSMQGRSLLQARESLLMAIGSLVPQDRFNLIEFNSQPRALFSHPVAADADALVTAERWIMGLEANGGTHMAPALALALAGEAPPSHVRQVVFITDGSVGNEVELFAQIEAQLGEARLFTVGIGSAPNSYFMRKAAEFGRGSHTLIGDVAAVTEQMDALLTRLEHPALTDLCVDWPEAADVYPQRLPDLYRGDPLVVVARLDRLAGEVELCGQQALGSWNEFLPLKAGEPGEGIGTLWARRRIEGLMDDLALGADATQVRDQVLETALAHRLVSRYTAFVAVDQTPARSREAALTRARVANLSPDAEPSSAELALALPQTGTEALQRIILGAMLMMLAWVFALRLRDETL